MKALCYILILTLLSLIAVSEVNGGACDSVNENAVPLLVAQHAARMTKQLQTRLQPCEGHKIIEEIRGNFSLLSQHGSGLMKVMQFQTENDILWTELQATIATLDEWISERNQFLIEFDKNIASLLQRICQREGKTGDGTIRKSADVTCNGIRKYYQKIGRNVTSSVRWINPSQKEGAEFQIYCDFESFGGGWSLVYSSRDDSSGNNNMKEGNRSNANITSLDPGNANKRLAYDVLKAIENSKEGYSQIMLTGYQDYGSKNPLIKMYFNKTAISGLNFDDFLEGGLTRQKRGCGSFSYYGKELSSGKNIALSWEDDAFVAGAVSSGCAWSKEVWNEIDNNGGHILAPAKWNNAEGHEGQTTAKGASKHRGLYHMFVR